MSLWDPIRCLWVKKTPEESVRQQLIEKMIGSLGYPRGLIAVEKELAKERRFDLVCYFKVGEELKPLLLVECKADCLNEAAVRQAWGYNESIKAPFLCLASASEVKTVWKEEKGIAFVSFLPKYLDLLSACRKIYKR